MSEIEFLIKDNKEIKEQLKTIEKQISSLKEQKNKENINTALETVKKDVSYSLTNYLQNNLKKELNHSLNDSCSLKKDCNNLFEEMIQENIRQANQKGITPEYKNKIKKKIHEVRLTAPTKECNSCLDNIEQMTFNHMDLLDSINNQQKFEQQNDTSINNEKILKEVLEPVTNKQRLQILEKLAEDNLSHSELSKLTKLRGGNLLFHLEKLKNANLIIQKHERSNYIITKKGYNILLSLSRLEKTLKEI
ncbi:MAG: winged helix-turn-helix domain-containing protein [Methanobacteriaceae archaeon]|nr:winged helix-turn-helix domain-containing protein [Methanobacteriaceae archaeon]